MPTVLPKLSIREVNENTERPVLDPEEGGEDKAPMRSKRETSTMVAILRTRALVMVQLKTNLQ